MSKPKRKSKAVARKDELTLRPVWVGSAREKQDSAVIYAVKRMKVENAVEIKGMGFAISNACMVANTVLDFIQGAKITAIELTNEQVFAKTTEGVVDKSGPKRSMLGIRLLVEM